MNTGIYILFIIGFILFIAYAALVFGFNSGLSRDKKNYIRNSYPYEYYMTEAITYRVLVYVVFGISVLCLSIAEALYLSSFQTTYLLILSIFFPLSLISLSISNVLSFYHYRMHLFFSAMGFFLYAAFSLLLSVTTIVPGGYLIIKMNLPIQIIIGALGGVALLSLFNRRLADWGKMERAEDNGKVFYVHPKVNFYALYEWIFLFMMETTGLLMFLDKIITDLTLIK